MERRREEGKEGEEKEGGREKDKEGGRKRGRKGEGRERGKEGKCSLMYFCVHGIMSVTLYL